jgi:mediator of RNA polymerase II transcription subunit 13
MDFLERCKTNAQAIGDFEAIAYHAFSVTRGPSAALLHDRQSFDDTRAAEASLRQQQCLVVQDASRPWLWLFRPTTLENVGQPPQDLPVLDGFDFQRM